MAANGWPTRPRYPGVENWHTAAVRRDRAFVLAHLPRSRARSGRGGVEPCQTAKIRFDGTKAQIPNLLGNILARLFLGASAKNEVNIQESIADYLSEAMTGARFGAYSSSWGDDHGNSEYVTPSRRKPNASE